MLRFLVVAAFVGTTAGLYACGESDEERVREVWREATDALLAGDGDRYCGLWTDDGLHEIVEEFERSCPSYVRQLSRALSQDDRRRLEATELRRVAVRGDEATGYPTGEQAASSVAFAKKNGRWKLHADPDPARHRHGPGPVIE